MNKVPQIEPVSKLSKDHKSVLDKLADGPVVLAHRSTAKAVLSSVDQWNKMVGLIEDQEDIIEALKMQLAIARGEVETETITDFDSFAAEMMETEFVPA